MSVEELDRELATEVKRNGAAGSFPASAPSSSSLASTGSLFLMKLLAR